MKIVVYGTALLAALLLACWAWLFFSLSGELVKADAMQATDEHGRFVNLDGTRAPSILSGAIWKMVWHDVIAGRRGKGEGVPPGMIVVDPDALAAPPQAGARITWLGHASWLVQLDGVSLMIDPNFADSLPQDPRVVPLPVDPERLPRVDAALVSHTHHDHMDVPTLAHLKTKVIAGLRAGEKLRDEGLNAEVVELGWWGKTQVGPVTIHFVPSQHSSRRTLTDEDSVLWGGFVIEGRSARIYHAGDTAYFQGFTQIGARFGALDAAILPIGAYEPEWYCTRDHLTPEGAVQAFQDLGARSFFAMHFGTFKLSDEPLDAPPKRLLAECARRGLTQCHVPLIGESTLIER